MQTFSSSELPFSLSSDSRQPPSWRLSPFWAASFLSFAAHAAVGDQDSDNASIQSTDSSFISSSDTSATPHDSSDIEDDAITLFNPGSFSGLDVHVFVATSSSIGTSIITLGLFIPAVPAPPDADGSTVTLPVAVPTTAFDQDGSTPGIPAVITTSITLADADGNTVTLPVVIPTTTADQDGTTAVPIVITTSTTTTDANGNTFTVPLISTTSTVQTLPAGIPTTDETGGIVPVPMSTNTDDNASIITIPNGITMTDSTGGTIILPTGTTTTDSTGGIITIPPEYTTSTAETIPHGFATATTDVSGVIIPLYPAISTTDAHGILITRYPTTATTDAYGVIIPLYPTTTSTETDFTLPIPLFGALADDLVISSMSAISSEFRALLPLFSSWEQDPSPPHQTHITNGHNGNKGKGIKADLDDLMSKSLKPDPRDVPRSASEDLHYPALRTPRTIFGTDPPDTDNPEDDDPDDDDDDDGSTLTHSTSSTSSTSSSCTSDATAHQVTVLCEPTIIIEDRLTNICDYLLTNNHPYYCRMLSEFCKAETCGDACPSGDGSGGWVTLRSVDCAHISTITVSVLPTGQGSVKLASSNAHHTRNLGSQVEGTADPLPEFPAEGPEQTEYLTGLATRLTNENKWLVYRGADVTAQWYPFGNERLLSGVSPLNGCTSVLIITKKGVWVSHIFERPVFIDRDEEGIYETPNHYFQYNSFNILAHAGHDVERIQPVGPLIGTDAAPGPLHYTLEPKIFIITPIEEGLEGADLQYEERIEWLSDQWRDFLYPHGCSEENKPFTVGYQVAPARIATHPSQVQDKVIFEATPIQQWLQAGDQQLAIGRWWLWVCGKKTLEYDFWDIDAPSGHPAARRRLEARDNGPVCHVSSLFTTTSSTSTTFITTTKSDTLPPGWTMPTHTSSDWYTPSLIPGLSLPPFYPTATQNSQNPPGQPLGFTITTAEPTTATTSTSGPPGALPSDASHVSPMTCYEKNNFAPAPIDPRTVQSLADFCSRGLTDDQLTFASTDDEPVKFDAASPNGYPFYYVKIEWEEDCNGQPQNVQIPMEGYSCGSIIKEIFEYEGYTHGGGQEGITGSWIGEAGHVHDMGEIEEETSGSEGSENGRPLSEDGDVPDVDQGSNYDSLTGPDDYDEDHETSLDEGGDIHDIGSAPDYGG
ncbi:hypothetical protein BDV12DRAFT_202572 [Aspergillus spectabilis]